MFQQYDIGIFGGDLRQVFITISLLEKGFRVATYGIAEAIPHKNCLTASSLQDLIDRCPVLVGPIPMTREQVTITSINTFNDLTVETIASNLKEHHFLTGGKIPSSIADICNHKNIAYFDFMKDESIAIQNAIATAEGTIMEAIKGSDRNLHGSNCLILGYGRCAKILANKLKGMDARVTISARREEALSYAYAEGFYTHPLSSLYEDIVSFPFIFNTIPSLVLDKSLLSYVDPDATLIDIASSPGGIDYKYAREHNLNANLCLGLPGKVAPRTSADILVTKLTALIKERSG